MQIQSNAEKSTNSRTAQTFSPRDVLAVILLTVGALGIFVTAGATIWASKGEAVHEVFTAMVGLCGGWVSTILVFYFSRENFVTAQNAVNNTLAAAGFGANSGAIGVRMAMVSRTSMKVIAMTDKQTEKDIPFKELCDLMTQQDVTRIPILAGEVVRYIVHDTSIYRYLSDGVSGGQPVDPVKTTLEDFLNHQPSSGDVFRTVVSCMAYASIDATIDDAKAALVKTGARNVVITKSGSSMEPVLGWLTDLDIARAVQG